MAKTLTQQLAEANEALVKAEAQIAALESRGNKKKFDIHESLDACLDYFNDNKFYIRNVNSEGIASLVRSAREKLRIATKK